MTMIFAQFATIALADCSSARTIRASGQSACLSPFTGVRERLNTVSLGKVNQPPLASAKQAPDERPSAKLLILQVEVRLNQSAREREA
jgi:hypothetical protein